MERKEKRPDWSFHSSFFLLCTVNSFTTFISFLLSPSTFMPIHLVSFPYAHWIYGDINNLLPKAFFMAFWQTISCSPISSTHLHPICQRARRIKSEREQLKQKEPKSWKKILFIAWSIALLFKLFWHLPPCLLMRGRKTSKMLYSISFNLSTRIFSLLARVFFALFKSLALHFVCEANLFQFSRKQTLSSSCAESA